MQPTELCRSIFEFSLSNLKIFDFENCFLWPAVYTVSYLRLHKLRFLDFILSKNFLSNMTVYWRQPRNNAVPKTLRSKIQPTEASLASTPRWGSWKRGTIYFVLTLKCFAFYFHVCFKFWLPLSELIFLSFSLSQFFLYSWTTEMESKKIWNMFLFLDESQN